MAKTKKYPGAIEKRGDGFRLILQLGGDRHTYTKQLRGLTRKEVEQFARDEFDNLKKKADRVRAGLAGVVKFSTLLDQYKKQRLPTLRSERTRATYQLSLDRFENYFVTELGDPDVGAVRRAHVKGFLEWRRTHRLRGSPSGTKKLEEAVSNRTIAKDRAVLHAVFNYAVELEHREDNPVARVSTPKSDTREPIILSDDQYEKLLTECAWDQMLELYVLTLGESGTRSESEALWLRWEDVQFEENFFHVRSGRGGHRTKSGKGRLEPMSSRLREAMRNHFATYRFAAYDSVRSPWVFHHTRRRRNATEGSRIVSLRRAVLGAATRAEIPDGFHVHDLRHRRVTTWLADGKNAVHVKEAVGHSDLRTTMGYTHLAKEHLRSFIDDEPSPKRSKETA